MLNSVTFYRQHLALVAMMGLILLSAFVLTSPARARDMENLKGGVVVVIADEGALCGQKIGSGMVVRQDANRISIVTASHVVEGCKTINVQFYSQKIRSYPAKVLSMEGDDPDGLAIVTVTVPKDDMPTVTVLPLDSQLPVRSGDVVSIVGFPRKTGVKWAVTKGESIGIDGRKLKFSGLVDGGNSGGPLLKDGKVIGIVTQTQGDFSFAVPSLIVRYILEGWGVQFGVQLRKKPASLTLERLVSMIQEFGFHHPADLSTKGFAPSSQGTFQHQYEILDGERTKGIVDHATGLMWKDLSLREGVVRDKAGEQFDQWSQTKPLGFDDWRLPTIEELASLVEPIGLNDGNYLHPFLGNMTCAWSGDLLSTSFYEGGEISFEDAPLYVDFHGGAVLAPAFRYQRCGVFGVRTFQP